MSHKDLRPEDITAVIDTREKTPWALTQLKTQQGTLITGDYTILGLEHEIALERKSLSDLLACVGGARKRFVEELERLHAYPTRCVIVECTFRELSDGGWTLGLGGVRSRVSAASAMGSVLGWIAAGVPFLFAGSHEEASTVAARIMFIAANRRFKELAGFYRSLKLS